MCSERRFSWVMRHFCSSCNSDLMSYEYQWDRARPFHFWINCVFLLFSRKRLVGCTVWRSRFLVDYNLVLGRFCLALINVLNFFLFFFRFWFSPPAKQGASLGLSWLSDQNVENTRADCTCLAYARKNDWIFTVYASNGEVCSSFNCEIFAPWS